MSSDDAAVPAAALSLADPRPSRSAIGRIDFDVYGDLAKIALAQPAAGAVDAATLACVVIYFHGGGFAAGDKKLCERCALGAEYFFSSA
jgi:hypothetical protein